jgi:hypothetical protein
MSAPPTAHAFKRRRVSVVAAGNYLMARADGLVGALCEPTTREPVILATLAVYAAIWTLFAVVSKSTQAMHADPAEIAVLSRALEWGSWKHPPALPAIAWAWFHVWPQTDAFYYLLAVSMSTAALYITWRLAGLFLDNQKRVAVPFLLMCVPSYNFLSLKFDHNTAQTFFWALVTYTFVRSFQSRTVLWSVVTGASAAAALLAKYWSVLLLGGLGVAALLDARRKQYLKSAAPWVAAAVAIVCLIPHLEWVYRNHLTTWHHATRVVATSAGQQVLSLLMFVGAPIAYLAIPLIFLAIWARPIQAPLHHASVPVHPDHRLLWAAYLAPFGLAILGAIIIPLKLGTLWTACMLTLAPVVFLMSRYVEISRRAVARLVLIAFGLGIGALALAPAVALKVLLSNDDYDALYVRQLVGEVQQSWYKVTARPIRLVAGPFHLANIVAYYLPDRPLAYSLFPRPTPTIEVYPSMSTDGFAMVCPASNDHCINVLFEILAVSPTVRQEVEVIPTWLGFSGAPRRFTITILAPRD